MRPMVALIGLGLTIGSAAAAAQATSTAYPITNAHVAVICPLTVGGSFEARTSAVVGSLGVEDASRAVTGAVQVDLATLETGIELRDQHMKQVYLEIGRGDTFATARLEEIGVGLLTALGLSRLMQGVLFQVSARDPLTYAIVAAALLAVAFVASYVPARRAGLADPAEFLRG
jgi:hypothetical protein